MKIILLIIAMLFSYQAAKGQIILEHSYPGSAGLTQLSVSGYRYFTMDVYNNHRKMYNTDHSVWKIVNLPVPAGMYLYDIRHVSENLFNTDNKVELVYTYYNYDTTLLYFTYYSKVIDEDGVELLTIPGASYSEVRSAGTTGTKMLAYVYDYSTYPSTMQTMVYALPGNIPSVGRDAEGGLANLKAYPNPARSTITMPYELPDGITTGAIQVMNSLGVTVKVYKVDRSFMDIRIPVEDLPKGVYYYQLKTANGISGRGTVVHD